MKKSHRVAHENQRRGGFCYYHYTTFFATVKIPFSKKNTSPAVKQIAIVSFP